MKDIQFKAVGLENFGGYHEKVSLEFENGKLFLITGPNGAGKTTLFDCICYALYGRTTKGGTGEDVINNIAKKNCRCWVDFSIDGVDYSVDRYVKYSKHGTTVYLKKGKETIKKGHNEVVPYIEQLFMSYKLFMNTLMFTQKVKDFFTDLNDSAQKEIFRKILLLDDYILYQQTALDKYKNINEYIEKIKNQISIDENVLDRVYKQIAATKDQKQAFDLRKERELETLLSKIHETEESINSINNTLNKYKDMNFDKQKEELLDKLTTIRNKIESIKTEANAEINLIVSKKSNKEQEFRTLAQQKEAEQNLILSEKSKECSEMKYKAKEKYDKEIYFIQTEYNESKNKRTLLESNKNRLLDELKEYKDSSNLKEGSTCPTCKQVLSKEAKQELDKRVENIEVELNKIDEEIADISLKAAEIKNDRVDIAQNEYNKVLKEVDVILEEANREKTSQLKDIATRLNNVLQQVLDISNKEIDEVTEKANIKASELKEEGIQINEQLKDINETIETINKYKIELSRLENERVVLRDRHTEIQRNEFDKSLLDNLFQEVDTIKYKIKQQQDLLPELIKKSNIYDFWKKVGFSSSGIPSMLIDESIPFMNKRVSEYSEQIAGGRYIISFDTLKANKDGKEYKDKINVEVFDTQTKSDKRVKFSGGQTRIVDIATILTLRDLQSNFQNMKINILLFDEIFDSLDDENIGYVSKLLKSLVEDSCVVIISHRHFDSIEADEIFRLAS